MKVDNELSRLQLLKSNFDSNIFKLEDSFIYKYPNQIKKLQAEIECPIKDIEKRNLDTPKDFKIHIEGKVFDERDKAGTYILALFKDLKDDETKVVDSFKGFELSVTKSIFSNLRGMTLHGSFTYFVEFGDSTHGNMVRLENLLEGFEKKVEVKELTIKELERNTAQTKEEFAKLFAYKVELEKMFSRQSELNVVLDMSNKSDDVIVDEKSIKDEFFDAEDLEI